MTVRPRRAEGGSAHAEIAPVSVLYETYAARWLCTRGDSPDPNEAWQALDAVALHTRR